MVNKLPEITSSFFVTADFHFDPHVVSARVPISPTYVKTKGDFRPGDRPPVVKSIWCFECEDRRIQSLDEGLREVLEVVWPHRAAILDVMCEVSLSSYFQSYVRIHDLEFRVVHELLADTIQRMADLKAEWSMDLYDFTE